MITPVKQFGVISKAGYLRFVSNSLSHAGSLLAQLGVSTVKEIIGKETMEYFVTY